MSGNLLSGEMLPVGFTYPKELVRLVENDLTYLDPWVILTGEPLEIKVRGLAERYTTRTLIPVAQREDNDDVACYELIDGVERIVLVHDYAAPGWESRGNISFSHFRAWFHQAVEDMFDFE